MHQGVAVIVYARNPSGALTRARVVLKKLTNGANSYDGFQFHNYDDLPATPVLADTAEGERVIEYFWKLQSDVFRATLKKVRYGVETIPPEEFLLNEGRAPAPSTEEPSLERDPDMVRYYMHRAGEYVGPSIQLYDNDGGGIRDRHHLKNALDKWQSALYAHPSSQLYGQPNPAGGMSVWVVTADVHY